MHDSDMIVTLNAQYISEVNQYFTFKKMEPPSMDSSADREDERTDDIYSAFRFLVHRLMGIYQLNDDDGSSMKRVASLDSMRRSGSWNNQVDLENDMMSNNAWWLLSQFQHRFGIHQSFKYLKLV